LSVFRTGEADVSGKAAICGGSIGGLFAAAALLKEGWDVTVFERSSVPLHGRGAGIVTHPELVRALEEVDADTADLGVPIKDRVAFAEDGRHHATLRFPQVVTSWDRMHQSLRRLVPDTRYRLAHTLMDYEQDEGGVELRFREGGSYRADLLIGADGFRSAVRAKMLPHIQPAYSGYLVWRALADEADLDADLRAQFFNVFGIYMPTGMQIIGYPIPGADNDTRPGHRRYNFVWYVPVPQDELQGMLTDADGRRHRISIPPPLVRGDLLEKLEREARDRLPALFVHVLEKSERPFFTPIYDHHSPVMADGRVVLSGDAACVARPHIGMGVTKAADDALSLTRHLKSAPVPEALQAYSRERVPAVRAAFEQSRKLGSYLFEEPASGSNQDGCNNPNQDEILRLTAVSDFPGAVQPRSSS
jgi:2-polyprenyl-6-methoxyphenol hydroxylase-like FAD-dependent oxidoreductase